MVSAKIDPAMLGNGKKPRGNNLSVGDDDNDVGRKLFKELLDFRRADFLRLVHGKVGGERNVLHRGNGKLVAATAGTVGLRDYA
jgi:hypothetical protein